MPTTVFDDYAININPDVILGFSGGGRTLGNPDIEALDGFAIREIRLADDGTPISGTWHMMVTLENDGSDAEVLEAGTFHGLVLNSGTPIQEANFPLATDGVEGSAEAYEDFEDSIEGPARTLGDSIVNRTGTRSTVMVYDGRAGASGVAPVRKINLPANTTRTYYVANVTRANADVTTNINQIGLDYTTG